MPQCDNCGAFVTARFRQVFAIDGQLAACPNCYSSQSSIDEAVIEEIGR